MANQYDVIIVGGGVVGLACAYFLNRAGRSVCVLERGEVASGASFGNAGLITPSHGLPLCRPGAVGRALKSMLDQNAPFTLRPRAVPGMAGWLWRFARNSNRANTERIMAARVPLMNSTRSLTDKLVKLENLQCEWAPTGVLSVCNTEQGMNQLEALQRAVNEVGVKTELLEGAAMRRREPALLKELAGGLLFVGDGKLQPYDFVSELARVCRDKGVVIQTRREVAAVHIERGKVASVYTHPGIHRARHFVLASGVWSALLAKQFRRNLPIRPGKGYSITTKLPDPAPKRALILEERSIAVTPWANEFRLAGTMEFAGLDDSPNPQREDALIFGASEYLREPVGRGEQKRWRGFRPMTPDDLPLIGSLPDLPNMTLACGHNMMGMSMSLGTGRLVAELIVGAEPHIDPTPYSPTRFGNLRPRRSLVGMRRAVVDRA